MLRRHILTVAIATLALSVAGLAGCNKKDSKKAGESGGTASAMDMAPPATPVEPAMGGMGGDMRPAPMGTDEDMAAEDDKPQAGEMTLRMLTVGWKDSAIAVELKRSKADAKKIIDKALADAKKAKGEKAFIKVVKKFSDVNKENGGALPPFAPADSKDKSIAKAVSPLKVGQITGVVETAVGFNIFFRVK